MYKLDIKKLIQEVKGPKGVAALNEELHKVTAEIQNLSKSWKPQAEARLKQAFVRYAKLRSNLKKSQSVLEKEVRATVTELRKSAAKAETRIKAAISKSSKKKAKGSPTSKKTTSRRRTAKKA